MPTCLCCHEPLLRQFKRKHMVWFCRACWQDMPVLANDHSECVPPLYADHSPTARLSSVPPRHP